MAETSSSVVSNSANIANKISSVQSSDIVDESKTDKEMELITLDDAKYGREPRTLKNVLHFLQENKPDADKIDILIGLIYIIMLETNFVCIEGKDKYQQIGFCYQRLLNYSKNVPGSWDKGVYRIGFILPGNSDHECTLAFIKTADDLIVNFTVAGIDNAYFSVCLDPLTYFTSSTVKLHRPYLQNLDHLSRNVKDKIALPAQQTILDFCDMHYIGHPCLNCMPDLIIQNILSYLKVRDQIHFCMVNSHFYSYTKTSSFWSTLWNRDFKMYQNVLVKTAPDLRKHYIDVYLFKHSGKNANVIIY